MSIMNRHIITMFSVMQIWFILVSCAYEVTWFVTIQSETTKRDVTSNPDIHISLMGHSNNSRSYRLRDHSHKNWEDLFTNKTDKFTLMSQYIGTLVGVSVWDNSSAHTTLTLLVVNIQNVETQRQYKNECRCNVVTDPASKPLFLTTKPTTCGADRFGGNNCRDTCRCELVGWCGLLDGACVYGGCAAGWMSDSKATVNNCQTQCRSGSFGASCAYQCQCDLNESCDPVTGNCLQFRDLSEPDHADKSMTFEEIIGITLGSGFFALCLGLAIYCLIRYIQRLRRENREYFDEHVQMEMSSTSSESLLSSIDQPPRSTAVSFHSMHWMTGYDKTRDVREHKKSKLSQHLKKMRENRKNSIPKGILRKKNFFTSIKQRMTRKNTPPPMARAASIRSGASGRSDASGGTTVRSSLRHTSEGSPWLTPESSPGDMLRGSPSPEQHKLTAQFDKNAPILSDSTIRRLNSTEPPIDKRSISDVNVVGGTRVPYVYSEHQRHVRASLDNVDGELIRGPAYQQWVPAALPEEDDAHEDKNIMHVIQASRLRKDSIAVAKIHGVKEFQEQEASKGKIGEFLDWMAHPHLPTFSSNKSDKSDAKRPKKEAAHKRDGGAIETPKNISRHQRKIDHKMATRYDVMDIELNDVIPDLPEDNPHNFATAGTSNAGRQHDGGRQHDAGRQRDDVSMRSGRIDGHRGLPTLAQATGPGRTHEENAMKQVTVDPTQDQHQGVENPNHKHREKVRVRRESREHTEDKQSHDQDGVQPAKEKRRKKKRLKKHQQEPAGDTGGPIAGTPDSPGSPSPDSPNDADVE